MGGWTRRLCRLVRLRIWRNLKRDAAIFVLLAGGLEIEVGQRNFVNAASRQIKECLALDGVVSNFHLVTILEDQHDRFLRRIGLGIRVRSIGKLSRVRSGNVFYRGNVGSGSRSAAIENCGTALIVRILARISFVVCSVEVGCVGDRYGIKHGRIAIAMVSVITRALLAMLLTIVELAVARIAVVKLAVLEAARRWSVALRADGSGARRRTVHGAATAAGRGYRRGRTVNLRVAVRHEYCRYHKQAEKREGSGNGVLHRDMIPHRESHRHLKNRTSVHSLDCRRRWEDAAAQRGHDALRLYVVENAKLYNC